MEMLLREDFESRLNQIFTINLQGGGIESLLVEVKALGCPAGNTGREPFSLLFEANSAFGLLDQGIYSMSNSTLGEKPIFLVPVGKKNDRYQYEAVFN